MKKITLTALALMASAASFAQTTLWNGEDKELTPDNTAGFWNDGTPKLVENPETDGINTSSKCIMFKMSNSNKVVKLPFRDWIKPSMNGSKRISLMIKKNQAENVMVELSDPTDGSTNYWKKQAVYYTGEGKWQKLVFDYTTNGDFDNPGIMTITAQTGNVDGEQDVYIDNIVIEDAPRINGNLFSYYNDENKLTGNVKLTGAWMKGSSVNADVDPWQENTYNDYEYFYGKANDITSVDIREAQASDVDVNQFFKNPNTIVYANEVYDHANVVVGGNATNVELTDANAFAIPENFTAASVTLTRTLREDINSFVLPFSVKPDELGATELATYYNKSEGNKVTFVKKDMATGVEANVPFITCDVAADKVGENMALNFTNKDFVVTPASFDDAFKGVYAPQKANGLYGIDNNGNLHKGGETATINAFHAFYQPAVGQEVAAAIDYFTSETTGISTVTTTSSAAATAVYDLSGRRVADSLAAGRLAKGIYVVGGKKVAVK